jgi:hypothetical protein
MRPSFTRSGSDIPGRGGVESVGWTIEEVSMLTEEEKRDFVRSTVGRMANHTMPFLTQVVGVIDDRTGEHLGTGLFCTIEGRPAIVTAAHVLRQAATTGQFKEGLAFTRGSGEVPAIVAGKIVYSESCDLAVYLPSRDYPLGESKAFWPGERIDRSPNWLARDYLFVQGFPRRFSRFTTLNAMVSKSLAYGAMMRYQEKDIPSDEREQFDRDLPGYEFLPAGFLQSHQFALNFFFEPASFIAPLDIGIEPGQAVVDDWSALFQWRDTLPGQKAMGAFGLSGSPVWRIGAAGRTITDWTPQWSQLVGIVTSWNAVERVLIATMASKIFEIIREVDPEPARP